MRNLREWATPLTIGFFCLMSVTGILMFFHLDSGLNKTAHEWLGWLMVVAVMGHVKANFPSIKRYFLSSNLARSLTGLCLLVLAGSFISLPETGNGFPPPVLALKAVTHAPIASLAPLAGRSVDQIVGDLALAGIVVPDASASLDSVLAGNRELERKAMFVLFGKR